MIGLLVSMLASSLFLPIWSDFTVPIQAAGAEYWAVRDRAIADEIIDGRPMPSEGSRNFWSTNAIKPQAQTNTCDSPYEVQPGDSLRLIAKRCQVTLAELLAANPQFTNPDRIFIGSLVWMPSEDEASVVGTAADGTSVDGTSVDGTSVDGTSVDGTSVDVAGIPVTGLEPDPSEDREDESAAEEPAQQTYLVQFGESLGAIASRFGTTVGQLMFANRDIQNPNLIFPGQKLIIPDGATKVDENAWREQRLEDAAHHASELIFGEGGTYQPERADEHWVLVDLASQTLHAYEGQQVVRSFLVSTGLWGTPTVTGTYKIWIKLRTDDMSGPNYDLKDVPFVMYFYKGYGLHGTYWHNNFGTPMSHGCVNLATEDAEWLYNYLDVGSVVSVR